MGIDRNISPQPEPSQPSQGGGTTVPFGIIGLAIGTVLGYAYTRVTGYG